MYQILRSAKCNAPAPQRPSSFYSRSQKHIVALFFFIPVYIRVAPVELLIPDAVRDKQEFLYRTEMFQITSHRLHYGLNTLSIDLELFVISCVKCVIEPILALDHRTRIRIFIRSVIPSSPDSLSLILKMDKILSSHQMPGRLFRILPVFYSWIMQIESIICTVIIIWDQITHPCIFRFIE